MIIFLGFLIVLVVLAFLLYVLSDFFDYITGENKEEHNNDDAQIRSDQ